MTSSRVRLALSAHGRTGLTYVYSCLASATDLVLPSDLITTCRTDGDLQIETHPIMYDLHFSLPFSVKNSHSSRTPQQALGNGTLAFTGTDRSCGLFQDYRSLQRPKRSERNSYVELNRAHVDIP